MGKKFLYVGVAVGVIGAAILAASISVKSATYKTEFYSIGCRSSVFNTNCNLTLSNAIGRPSDYSGMQMALSHLTARDSVDVHLAGNGGIIDGAVYILGVMHNLKAPVRTIVDGNVASCHSLLAMGISKDVYFPNDGFIFLHLSSATNEWGKFCDERDKFQTDRGINAYEKCVSNVKAETAIDNRVMLEYVKKYLTKSELNSIMEGNDLFIDFTDWKRRIEK